MTKERSPQEAARELASLIADSAARAQAAPTPPPGSDAALPLIAALADDPSAVDEFFQLLGQELAARGTRLPSLDRLPPAAMPLVQALGAALDPGPDGEIDPEAAAVRLDRLLHDLLGESPVEKQDRQFDEQVRRRVAADVARALRRHGLVPERDAKRQPLGFWDLVDLARDDRAAFERRLASMPRHEMQDFYWAHAAAKSEWLRAAAPDRLEDTDADRMAAAIVAAGYAAHLAAVADAAPVSMPGTSADLGRDAMRVYRERFGQDIRFELPSG